jgi:hypothetical protein
MYKRIVARKTCEAYVIIIYKANIRSNKAAIDMKWTPVFMEKIFYAEIFYRLGIAGRY